MVEYKNDKALTQILKAVSDTTRRSLLTQLCQEGASRVTDLADRYDMSLNAISKHIKVLEKAGMTNEGIRRKILPIRGKWKDNFHFAIVEDEFPTA